MATSSTRRKVVLHFDLNRTVLMSDAAGGRTMENTVNYLLSECTWGYVHPTNPSEWVCVSEASSIAPPAAPKVTIDGNDVAVPLITYKQFVDDSLPYESLKDAGVDGKDTIEQIKAINKAAKKQRTALQSAFTGSGPGAPVIGSFNEVMEKLHFPSGPQREAAKDAAKSLPVSRLQEAWSEGRYYLLPSFMQFLAYLASLEDKYDVKLVFRTFGDDIPEVAKELELLVDGKHPIALETAIPASFKLTAAGAQVGTFYRDGFESDGTALAVGTLTKVPFTSAHQGDPGALETFYQGQGVEIVRGFPAIHRKVQEMAHSHPTIALRDYWEWWSAHAEAGEYGKLLLVDDSASSNDIAVFFDDHVEAHHSHIVDVRDVASGAPVPFSKSKGKYLQRVEPFAAITDPHYFINLVKSILQE